ncbi:MAG: hypothetical protein HDR14_16455 [Lachnospiraceae bacterium]|nr:hypothetical protein [Lachnospiraceae bacterium]
MLEVYAKEFVGIGSFLRKNGKVYKGYILIEKKVLEGMLDKNKYDTSGNKLKIWKALKWIDTEADRRLTKRVYDGESKTYKPYVKLDITVLEQLEKL